MDADILQVLRSAARDAYTVRYVSIATLAFLVYEYMMTVDEEVSLIWPSRPSLPKLLFFVNRYLPFISSGMGTYYLVVNRNIDICHTGLFVMAILSTTGYIFAECILFIRAYAIWSRKKPIMFLLIVVLLTGSAGGLYVTARYQSSAVVPDLTIGAGCLIDYPDRIAWAGLAIVLFSESLVLALLVVRAYIQFKYAGSPLMKLMMRDGLFYFLIIVVSTTVNLILMLVAPSALCDFLMHTQGVLHNVLCNRLLLRLRGAYDSLRQPTDTFGGHSKLESRSENSRSAPIPVRMHHISTS